MDVVFDPAKAASNRRKHGICLADAESVLHDPRALSMEDPDAEGEPRFVTVGMDAFGRVLVVVYAVRADEIRLISARKASRGERDSYHA